MDVPFLFLYLVSIIELFLLILSNLLKFVFILVKFIRTFTKNYKKFYYD